MATIKPFRAIHPNPFYADQLVFGKPQAESAGGLKTLLETPAGQALAYRDTGECLRALLGNEKLYRDKDPGMFVYEVRHGDFTQSGIWALAELDEPVKTHELTFGDSVRRIKNYREHTGLEGSPILLAYAPDESINRFIRERKLRFPDARYESPDGLHQLWHIRDKDMIDELTDAFACISDIYLADGHHRRRAAELLLPRFPAISALFMATDQLQTRKYNRVVLPERPVSAAWLFDKLLPHFYMQESFNNKPVQPGEERSMGLYIHGSWYHLKAKPNTYTYTAKNNIPDVSILQDYILSPLFHITDPGTDARLKHAGGDQAMAEMKTLFEANPDAVGFTLCPMTVAQFCAAADAGINLPPKSTWIDPKIPYGLLICQHD